MCSITYSAQQAPIMFLESPIWNCISGQEAIIVVRALPETEALSA